MSARGPFAETQEAAKVVPEPGKAPNHKGTRRQLPRGMVI
jgi:hypothetical protein